MITLPSRLESDFHDFNSSLVSRFNLAPRQLDIVSSLVLGMSPSSVCSCLHICRSRYYSQYHSILDKMHLPDDCRLHLFLSFYWSLFYSRLFPSVSSVLDELEEVNEARAYGRR